MRRRLLCIVAALATLASCHVETVNVAFVEDHQIDSPSDTVFGVLGILSQLQEVADRTVILGEVRGDLVQLRPEQHNSALAALADFEECDDTLYNQYRDYYAVINNCNYYLHHAPEDMYREGENVFVRERAAVSAIRAWTYLQLVLNYGRVIFYTEPLLSFSEIEEVTNDVGNRKELGEICDLLIPELETYKDVGHPQYGVFTYGSNQTINSSKFFFPIPLLLADMHLWRGSVRNDTNDYLKAAQYYRDYLVGSGYSISPSYANSYAGSEFDAASLAWNQLYTGNRNWDTERISVIPMSMQANYGKTSALNTTMELLQGSEALKDLADNQYYCFAGVTDEVEEDPDLIPSRYQMLQDSTVFGTGDAPQLLHYIHVEGEPVYARGDLRLVQPSAEELGEYTIEINKHPSQYPHISTYRSGHVYLCLAEAICRAGYPETAFCILKYGLSQGNMLMYNQEELPRLLLSGYTFYDFGNNKNQMGIHARGCGNVEMDTIFYVLPTDLPDQEKIEYVEDLICNELALDCSFEGTRYYDLMRFAHRRGADYMASRIARRANPENPDDELYNKLLSKDNWYLRHADD